MFVQQPQVSSPCFVSAPAAVVPFVAAPAPGGALFQFGASNPFASTAHADASRAHSDEIAPPAAAAPVAPAVPDFNFGGVTTAGPAFTFGAGRTFAALSSAPANVSVPTAFASPDKGKEIQVDPPLLFSGAGAFTAPRSQPVASPAPTAQRDDAQVQAPASPKADFALPRAKQMAAGRAAQEMEERETEEIRAPERIDMATTDRVFKMLRRRFNQNSAPAPAPAARAGYAPRLSSIRGHDLVQLIDRLRQGMEPLLRENGFRKDFRKLFSEACVNRINTWDTEEDLVVFEHDDAASFVMNDIFRPTWSSLSSYAQGNQEEEFWRLLLGLARMTEGLILAAT